MVTLLAVLAIVVLYLLACSSIMIKTSTPGSKIASETNKLFKSLSTWDEEELKKYASIFGINSETDTDIIQLLEIGRKYAAFIGEDKIDEIVELIESTFEQHHEYKGEHHQINMMIEASNLVAVKAPTFITINRTLGGDRDGESISSLYAAA